MSSVRPLSMRPRRRLCSQTSIAALVGCCSLSKLVAITIAMPSSSAWTLSTETMLSDQFKS